MSMKHPILIGLIALGLSIPAFPMQSAALPTAKSTENSCHFTSGSSATGGFEVVVTSTQVGGDQAITNKIDSVQLTLWSPTQLRKEPKSSGVKQLILVMPANLVREPNRDPAKYFDGDRLGFSGQYLGKIVRMTNAIFHYDQLNSDRMEISPDDLNDLMRSDGISANVDSMPAKLFDLPLVSVAGKMFQACISDKRAVTYTQPPGPVTTRAALRENVSYLEIDELMADYKTRLVTGNPFPAIIDVGLTVDDTGKVAQCQLLANPKLDRFADIKPKICPIVQRRFRFSPAKDRDNRPVSDYVKLGATVRSPCFGPGCKK
jgi:hypothetical protein